MRHIVFFLLMALAFQLSAQEYRSKKVGFQMEEPGNAAPPTIRLITPSIGTDTLFRTEETGLNLICEVKSELPIKLVQFNGDMVEVNEYGMFTRKLELVEGRNEFLITALDLEDQVSEHRVVFTYEAASLSNRIAYEAAYYGLLIGIDDYKDPDIPDLDNPSRDAGKLYETLTERYGFDPERITMLKNPTRSEIIMELDALRSKVTSQDNLLIFYAGHGYWDKEGQIGYWLPSDASKQNTVDWFRNSTLVDYLQAIRSKHTLLITDACFAGSIFKARSVEMAMDAAYERIYDLPSRKAMTSGTLSEVPDESVFIKYLIRRLNENHSTYLSSEELFSRIRLAVMSNSSVVPQYGVIQNVGNEGGDFIFLLDEDE